jgi:CIC family chloride channel protein
VRRVFASPQATLVLALAVGLIAGVGAIVFRELIVGATHLFTGRTDPSAVGRVANPELPALGPWYLLLVPVVGGLLYGPLVARFAPEARGHGVPEVMLAVGRHGGRIRPRVALVKALASAICIGSGGSVGREGPIVQIGAAMSSALGQRVHVDEARLRVLVACGAAGGIAATFNAPIAGVAFALEVILREFEAQALASIVLSSVTAAAIGRLAFGDQPFLSLPQFGVVSAPEYLLYALLGLVAALAGVAFIRVLYGMEDRADRLWRGPAWARPACGGVLLGLVLLALPQMYGVGYPVLEKAVDGQYALGFLLLLLIGKIIATSLTLSVGGSGGVFAPSLFMGAMLGSAFGQAAHGLVPSLTSPGGAYGIVGMGAVFAAASGAPATAVLIIFELTGDYTIILPLMVAIVVATVAARWLSADTIYTLKLRRRGIDLDARTPSAPPLPSAAAMGAVPTVLAPATTLDQALDHFAIHGGTVAPVAGPDGALAGVVALGAIERALRDDPDAVVGDIARVPPRVHADTPLDVAVDAIAESGEDGLPIVAPDGDAVVGWITQRDALSAYRSRPGAGQSNASRPAPAPSSPQPAPR